MWTIHPPRRWQTEAFDAGIEALRAGRRGIVFAATGTGKSLVQAELCAHALERLKPGRSIVVTAPRVLLVEQLGETIAQRCGPENVGLFYTSRKDIDRPIIVCCDDSLPVLAPQVRCAAWICDEAHRSQAPTIVRAAGVLRPVSAIGFSATAFRADERDSLTLWDEVIYRHGIEDAIRDGDIVDFEPVWWNGSGHTDKELDAICLDMIRGADGPGVVTARSVDDADAFNAYANTAGLRAAVVSSRHVATANKSNLALLRSGELDFLISIYMLAEGWDAPEVRWLCLRRHISSRVMFAQQVGRVLRTYPGKERAVVYDPLYLCREHSLFCAAAVGHVLEEEPEELVELDPEEQARRDKLARAVAVGEVEQWTSRLLLKMQMAGIAQPWAPGEAEPDWRDESASTAQVALIRRMASMTRWMPAEVGADVKASVEVVEDLPAGAASDLLSILLGVAKASGPAREKARRTRQWGRYRWRWPRTVKVEGMSNEARGEIKRLTKATSTKA